jgi:hypothetical protein
MKIEVVSGDIDYADRFFGMSQWYFYKRGWKMNFMRGTVALGVQIESVSADALHMCLTY